MTGSIDPKTTYIHLSDGPEVRPVEVTADFWEKIASRHDLHEGRLITTFYQSQNWTTWEMHPAGEEVIVLLSGAAELVLDTPEGEQIVPLQAGRACIIPQGCWHTARVQIPGDIMVITRGAGTQNRPL